MVKVIKNIGIIILICFCTIMFSACTSERTPLSVTFIDVSGAMSTDHTINIKFSQEDDYKDKYVDILVKSDTDGVELTLFKEFSSDDDKVKIKLDKITGYVSLDEYKLFNLEKEQTDSMVGYGDVLATNLVVNSNKEATLTFLAILGEKENGEFKTISEISKTYTLKVLKHTQN